MKRYIKALFIVTIAAALIILAHYGMVIAQEEPYTMPWSGFSAGGGAISNGGYSITSTFGQPVAGKVSDGAWTLTSGFLGFIEPPLMPNKLFFPLITK